MFVVFPCLKQLTFLLKTRIEQPTNINTIRSKDKIKKSTTDLFISKGNEKASRKCWKENEFPLKQIPIKENKISNVERTNVVRKQ